MQNNPQLPAECGTTTNTFGLCFTAPPPSVPEDPPAEDDSFELPTLEEVARATGTLQPQALSTPV